MTKFLPVGRKVEIHRKTKETDIRLALELDGRGRTRIESGIPFMDHMLTILGVHGFMDLRVEASGDTEVDDHHTVEDLGVCLGSAIRKALGEKKGIVRYGEATVPMDEALARVVVDLSSRPFFSYRVSFQDRKAGNFDVGLIKEFFRAVAYNAGLTLHIDLLAGEEVHHISEVIFKAFARAMDRATAIERRWEGGVPSSKGVL